MATAPLDFIIPNFETTIVLDVSGAMAGEIFSMTTSAEAIIEVDLALVKQAFQFQVDASDVTNVDADDIKFYLSETNFWNAGFKYNAADADVKNVGGTHNAIATGYPKEKSMVCHDFVRFLALRLFNTHHGVDLFDNELELLDNIRLKSTDVWTNMETELAKYNDVNGTGDGTNLLINDGTHLYSTNVHNESIVRRLYEQMIYTPGGKERFKTPYILDSGERQDLPFQENDTISLKLIINPESEQHLLTNVSPLEARSYRIIYKLLASPTAPSRAVEEGTVNDFRP